MTVTILQLVGLAFSCFSLGVSLASLFHYGGRRK